jgi:hypothetical protein
MKNTNITEDASFLAEFENKENLKNDVNIDWEKIT